jgi:murein endopeptidase
VNEKKGSWGPVDDMTRPLGEGSSTSMSCWSAGNCVAGGSYTLPSEGDNPQAFIVSEKSGRWGDTKQVSGLVALSKGGGDQILSLSCPSAGGCSAGGSYGYPTEGFVVSQAK